MSPAARPVVDALIKPNDRLTSFARLEIYNRQYWYRLIDCLYDDYPGLRALVGERKFRRLCRDYLEKYPSTSFTLRNLGQHLELFLRRHSLGPLALDMARLEWARIVAFDGEARPAVTVNDLRDCSPARLRLALQPYLSLLKLHAPLDDYLIALKQLNTDALRGEASNAVTSHKHKPVTTLRRPRLATVFVVVHRLDHDVYYKRLTPEQFTLLRAVQRGVSLAQACAHLPPARVADLQNWFSAWAGFGWFCRR